MGFRYRRSISVGKFFRINISTRGIGYSVGVPGMRYTRAANGSRYTTYSIPGTGLSYRQTHNGSQNSTSSGIISSTNIESASISNFRDAEAADLLAALDRAVMLENLSVVLLLFGFLFFCLFVFCICVVFDIWMCRVSIGYIF